MALAIQERPALSPSPLPPLPRGRDPHDWISYYERGREVARRSPEQAQPYFITASRLDPTSAAPLMALYLTGYRGHSVPIRSDDGLGHMLLDTIWPAAEDLLDQAVQLNPDLALFVMAQYLQTARITNAPVEFQRGLDAYTGQKWDRAVRELTRALDEDPADTRPLVWRGIAYAQLERWSEAQRDYQLVVAEFPCGRASRSPHRPGIFVPALTGAKLYFTLGYFALRGGDTLDAKVMLNRAVDCDQNFFLSHTVLGNLALARADTEAALTQYRLAVARRPGDAFLRFALGSILLALRRPDSARMELAEAVRLNPDFVLARFYHAEAALTEGRREDAASEYREFLARAPRREIRLIQRAEQRLREARPESGP